MGQFVAPGGGGVLTDGTVNTDRFSSQPRTELSLEWWNRVISWQVRHEPTEHRVVVSEVESTRWNVHLWIAAGVVFVVLAGAVLFGGLGLGYAALLGVVLAVLVGVLLRFEQKAGGDTDTVRQITVVDTPVWAGIKARMAEAEKDTPAAQRKRFDEEVERRTTRHKAAKAAAKDAGEDPPEYVKVDKADYIDKSVTKTSDDLLQLMAELLSETGRAQARTRLQEYCAEHPEYAEQVGRGVVDCGCVACEFNAATGVVPGRSGVAAATARRNNPGEQNSLVSRAKKAAGVSTTTSQRREARARKDLEKRRAAAQRREAEEQKKQRRQQIRERTRALSGKDQDRADG